MTKKYKEEKKYQKKSYAGAGSCFAYQSVNIIKLIMVLVIIHETEILSTLL